MGSHSSRSLKTRECPKRQQKLPFAETREERVERILGQCGGKVRRASRLFDYERATRIAKQWT